MTIFLVKINTQKLYNSGIYDDGGDCFCSFGLGFDLMKTTPASFNNEATPNLRQAGSLKKGGEFCTSNLN